MTLPYAWVLRLDGSWYPLIVWRRVRCAPQAPRLVLPSFLPNASSVAILDVCVRAIRRYTPEPHEIWVVDNNSPRCFARQLLGWRGVNVVLSRRTPVPSERRGGAGGSQGALRQTAWGSYANAVALEIGVRLVSSRTRYLVAMHMDTMPCRAGWLSFLTGKINDIVKAAGVRMETSRTPEGVLHVLGYVVDFQTYRSLGLEFYPRLPQCDVGDRVTLDLRAAGYGVYACRDTLHEPELVRLIPETSPLREALCDRSFDDAGNVIYLHMGRVIPKIIGTYSVEGRRLVTDADFEREQRCGPDAWLRLANEVVLR